MKKDEHVRLAKIFFNMQATGHENRKKIEVLQNHLGCDNRTARDVISQLIDLHIPIVTDMKNGGYFQARKDNEIDLIYVKWKMADNIKRGVKILKNNDAYKNFFPKGQLELMNMTEEQIDGNIKIKTMLNEFVKGLWYE